MKNFRLAITLMLLVLATGAMAKKVEISDARTVGINYFYERINLNAAVPFSSLTVTGEFTEQENGTPLYYVFSIGDHGFIMVSADDACYPILGYSFESSYDPNNIPPAAAYWFNKYKMEISHVIENSLLPDANTSSTWSRYAVADPSLLESPVTVLDVTPLITTNWNQDFPNNALCPKDPASGGSYAGRVPVGCVATSMSMIMYYWRYPETGNGQHCIFPTPGNYGPQCADFGNTTYDWNGMSNQPTKECTPLAVISYHCGVAVDMHYAPAGSGAYMNKVPNAMETYFKYSTSCYYQDRPSNLTTWQTTLRGELDAKRPLIYSGQGADGGHAWVCDGYQGTDQFHMNWGWGGSYNGYYTLNNLNPGGSAFNSQQGAVLSIQPDAAQYPSYCTGTTNITTTNFGTIEDGSGPIADYQNTANCSWLIAPDDSISTITLNFERFNLAAGDELKVYNGPSASSPLLGTYTGTSLPPSVSSTGAQMFITFTTNGSGTAPGWLFNYNANTIPFCESTTILTTATGDFNDGSDRFNYRNGTNCKWKITPENAATVTLVFNTFSTEADADKVQVYDLKYGTLLGAFSGTSMPPSVTATGGQMMIIWTSNSSVRGEGWDASYTITVGKDEEMGFDQLSIFPNPTTDKVNIQFSSATPQDVTLSLTTLHGERIYLKELQSFSGQFNESIDLTSFAKGVYLVKITSAQGSTVRKIVLH